MAHIVRDKHVQWNLLEKCSVSLTPLLWLCSLLSSFRHFSPVDISPLATSPLSTKCYFHPFTHSFTIQIKFNLCTHLHGHHVFSSSADVGRLFDLLASFKSFSFFVAITVSECTLHNSWCAHPLTNIIRDILSPILAQSVYPYDGIIAPLHLFTHRSSIFLPVLHPILLSHSILGFLQFLISLSIPTFQPFCVSDHF